MLGASASHRSVGGDLKARDASLSFFCIGVHEHYKKKIEEAKSTPYYFGCVRPQEAVVTTCSNVIVAFRPTASLLPIRSHCIAAGCSVHCNLAGGCAILRSIQQAVYVFKLIVGRSEQVQRNNKTVTKKTKQEASNHIAHLGTSQCAYQKGSERVGGLERTKIKSHNSENSKAEHNETGPFIGQCGRYLTWRCEPRQGPKTAQTSSAPVCRDGLGERQHQV